MEKEILTEAKIQKLLDEQLFAKNSAKYKAENLFIYKWESDFWVMMKSGLCYEYEIKISRGDFQNDFKLKSDKHLVLQGKPPIKKYCQIQQYRPNYFYYVVPEGMITADEVPDYAGLIYVKNFNKLVFDKKAPKITDYKASLKELNLTDKFYYNYKSYKAKGKDDHKLLLEYKDKERKDKQLKEMTEQITSLKNKCNDYLNESKISNYIISELRYILKDNNVDFDYAKLEKDAIERYKKKC